MSTRFFPSYDSYKTTSPFGDVRSWGVHEGVDLVAVNSNGGACADSIVAFDDGVVIEAGYNAISGYFCKIKHNDVYSTLYCHMKVGTMAVKKGQAVKKGDILGYMGRTGRATGAHLHLGLSKCGVYVDPVEYFDRDLTEYDTVPVNCCRRRLKKGSSGSETMLLQNLLNISGAKLSADGVFGKLTDAAVRDFQSAHGLEVDGIVGKLTWNELLK